MNAEEIDELPEQFHLPPVCRSCAFCGGTERLSNEHEWPKWVPRALKERMGLDKSARSFMDLSRETRRPTELINIKAPICEACNSRWLSTFENDAQAVLEPLVTGRPRPLTWQEQMIVATWAVKTALMVDLSSGSEAIIPMGFLPGVCPEAISIAQHGRVDRWLSGSPSRDGDKVGTVDRYSPDGTS